MKASDRSDERIDRAAGDERGLNLIEVIVALALLAMVLLGISTLFVRGSRSVSSGRQLTEASSVGTRIMEDLTKLPYDTLYTNMGATASSTSASSDTRTTTAYANKWQSQIDQMLSNPGYQAYATIQETPLGGSVSPPTFGSAKAIRVLITVQWREGATRVRTASFETVRF